MIPLLNYTHDVARFKCEWTSRIENDIYFSTGIYCREFSQKKKKVPLVQSSIPLLRFHTVLSVYFPLDRKLYILCLSDISKFYVSNVITRSLKNLDLIFRRSFDCSQRIKSKRKLETKGNLDFGTWRCLELRQVGTNNEILGDIQVKFNLILRLRDFLVYQFHCSKIEHSRRSVNRLKNSRQKKYFCDLAEKLNFL